MAFCLHKKSNDSVKWKKNEYFKTTRDVMNFKKCRFKTVGKLKQLPFCGFTCSSRA